MQVIKEPSKFLKSNCKSLSLHHGKNNTQNVSANRPIKTHLASPGRGRQGSSVFGSNYSPITLP
jgi:hypothetical protein